MISKEPKLSVFTVVISEKGGAERREYFDRSELSVGRVQGNDLTLPKGNVSKRHARLLYRDGRFIVTDLNSTNGTYVNRRRISQATIVREGDRIYIGDFILRIEAGERESSAMEKTGDNPGGSAPSSVRNALDADARPGDAPVSAPEESAPSYPQVPGPPRMPSGARLEPSSDAHSSGRVPLVEVSRPSVSERSSSVIAQLERAEEDTAQRRAVSIVMDRVKQVMGLAAVPEEPDPVLAERVENVIREQVGSAAAGSEFAEQPFRETIGPAVQAELLDVGPLRELLEDPAVSEITLGRFDHLMVQRDGQLLNVASGFSSEATFNLAIRRLCRHAGVPISAEETIVERRFSDGTKLSAVVGPAAPTGALLVIRKPKRIGLSLEDLVRRGTISRAIATFLQQCLAARINLLLVGPAAAEVSALLSALGSASGDSRLVAIQEFDDISFESPASTRLSLPSVASDALRILRLSSSVPGSRLLIELSNREISAALVEVIGEGADGVLASVRASNLRRALTRMPADIVAARPGTSIEAAREWIASSFDIAVEISKLADGRQRVLRVSELVGISERAEIRLQDIFTFVIERTAAGGSIEGTFTSNGVVPRVADEMRARGISLETSLFTRPPSR